jgi:hypothetical protein
LPRDAARQPRGGDGASAQSPRLRRQAAPGGPKATPSCKPRAAVSLASATRSRFAGWYAGEPGIDPYTRGVSDVYQDLFGEGVVRREGHLRRGCVRASGGTESPREPHPQPRPDRGLLCAVRACHRRGNSSKSHRPATSPTPSGVTGGCAGTGQIAAWLLPRGAVAGRAFRFQSAQRPVALEDSG